MGNIISKQRYVRLDAKTINETAFECYTEVSSASRNAKVVSVTDETFGHANNLLNITTPELFTSKKEEGNRDGWIVKRHEAEASVTISLCNTSRIFGVEIDTTGFKNICPTHALVEGYQITDENTNGMWTTLVKDEPIKENSHNFFQMNNNDNLYSLVRLTVSPGGGIARFRTYGDIVPDWSDVTKEYNLASANDGARIVRWSDMETANKTGILMDNGTLPSHGWLTPRSKKNDRNDFIVIQLSSPGIIKSVDVDTSGFIGNSPKTIRIEGCNSPEDDPYYDVHTQWIPLVALCPTTEDYLHKFLIRNDKIMTHIRLTVFPDGGVQQIKCFGLINQDKELEYTQYGLLKNRTNTSDIVTANSFTSEGSSLTVVPEELEEHKPAIEELNICNNMPLLPPPIVDETIPIVDSNLYEQVIIEELNGSTTQLLIPASEETSHTDISANDEKELAASEKPLVEQLNLTNVSYSPANTQPSENITVEETTTVETTTIIEETIMEVETTNAEPMDLVNQRPSEKRKSPEAELEQSSPKKRAITPRRSPTPRRAKSRFSEKEAVKQEVQELMINSAEAKKGRGRPKKQQ